MIINTRPIDYSSVNSPQYAKLEEIAKLTPIKGRYSRNRVYMIPTHWADSIGILSHELGHAMGQRYSFKELPPLSELLKLKIDFTEYQYKGLFEIITGNYSGELSPVIVSIIQDIYRKIFGTKFDDAAIKVIGLTKVDDLVSEIDLTDPMRPSEVKVSEKEDYNQYLLDLPTFIVSRQGKIKERNIERDLELSAIYMQFIVGSIFENSIAPFMISKPEFIMSTYTSNHHQRAANIVMRLIRNRATYLPSAVDLGYEENFDND